MEFLLFWGVGLFLFFPLCLSVSVFPPSIWLVDESTQAGSGHVEWTVGWWCAKEFSESENLPSWILILDLLLLQ